MDTRFLFFDESSRVRSGWRFLIFCLCFIGLVFVIAGLGSALLLRMGASTGPESPVFIVANGMFILAAALLAGWLCGRFLEGLPFRALGTWFTKGWLRNMLAGIFVGGVTLSVAVLLASIFGNLRFSPNLVDSRELMLSLAISMAIFAVGAASEEVLFRGYLFQTLNRSGWMWIGVALTSIVFGYVHTKNENANVISTLNTMLAGIWFCVAYLKTRDLWFVWGIHFMWNWMQGSFFGIEVSGWTDFAAGAVLREADVGPAWLTGEKYGVEGGIVTTIALLVSIVAIYFMPWLKPSADMMKLTSVRTGSGSDEEAPLLV